MFHKNLRNRASTFFNISLPGQIRKASNYFGNKILPHARLANRLIQNVNSEVQNAKFVDPSVKKASGNVSSFASVGLKHLQDNHSKIASRFDD